MELAHLTLADWAEFKEKYPSAENYLLEKSLERELAYLEKINGTSIMNGWKIDRLKVLRRWKKNNIPQRKEE